MVEKQLIKEYDSGAMVYDFDPADGYEDSEHVNEGCSFKRRLKGLGIEFAEKGRERRLETSLRKAQYQEFVPCVKCMNCYIVRVSEHGEYRNRIYTCGLMKSLVSRYGTCINAREGKNGPMVIEVDRAMEDIEAHKSELVN